MSDNYHGNPFKPVLRQLSSRELSRIDNRINQRSVINWTLIGSAYKNGRKTPGCVHLELSGGGFIWYPEDTPLDAALDDAADRGYEVATIRARTDHWVATGE